MRKRPMTTHSYSERKKSIESEKTVNTMPINMNINENAQRKRDKRNRYNHSLQDGRRSFDVDRIGKNSTTMEMI